ncbi:MAG: (2Fe-2S) ferredoxin domain-containing protein [Vampirovibrio sp.]|nr:(2Fe-2S) ferredoxin domain-containing protein [Vampirovibrio sp.]
MPTLDPEILHQKCPVTAANIQRQVFVCTGVSCSNNNSQATLEKFWEVLKEKGLLYGKRGSLDGTVIVTTCGSVGLCAAGPAVLVYPDGVWYYGVMPEDVEEIAEKHLIQGKVVDHLLAMRVSIGRLQH